ncbi:siderophore-interacting protein [Chitinophaga oryzae]|uniref:Siderophore-interacting protein n=1 Tax=Chitinophaga oryzae TaxID=2725414 RepID=A0ABX6LGT5_9BACT|nr:siderophore-interacting protein [Chitinophaga oryzae]QJB39329.1 siderophore-interacting protein [Chitinophaga oryzae]
MKPQTNHLHEGIIVDCKKMTATSWHLKIKVMPPGDFDTEKITGYVLPVLIGNSAVGPPSIRRLMLWNYDAIRHIIDLTIQSSEDTTLAGWLGRLETGNVIQWGEPEEIVTRQLKADSYYLIGNTDALAFFYQFNRNLPFVSNVQSFIYSEHTGEFFPDIDGSYPLNYHIIYPFSPERVLDFFRHHFKKAAGDFVVLLAADKGINQQFQRFLKAEWLAGEHQIKVANFDPSY